MIINLEKRNKKTMCVNKHAFTSETSYYAPNGVRRCRICMKRDHTERDKSRIKKYGKEYRQINKDKLRQQQADWSNNNFDWFSKLKSGLQCTECGESRPACLDFHHVDPSQKEETIGRAWRRWGKERTLKEIAKCIVLCRNCHACFHWGAKYDTALAS